MHEVYMKMPIFDDKSKIEPSMQYRNQSGTRIGYILVTKYGRMTWYTACLGYSSDDGFLYPADMQLMAKNGDRKTWDQAMRDMSDFLSKE
jgi:hypothetical protein